MRKGLVIVAAAACIALSPQARADYTYTSYSVLNNQNVTVHEASGVVEYVGAGEITLSGGSLGSIDVWCSDLFDVLQSPGSFSTLAPFSGPTADKVNALISNGGKLLGSNPYASAALQIAIWETLFPYPNFVVADNSVVNTLATTMFNQVAFGNWQADPNERVMMLSGNGNQSQVYLEHIPEPATLAVLGIGLLGIAIVRRGAITSALPA